MLAIVLSGQALACYDTSLVSPTPFLGNHGEIFKLSDGTLWEVQYEYKYMYKYYPTVIACPNRGFVIVGDTRLSARQITGSSGVGGQNLIESKIEDTADGYEYGKIFKLTNGQIWEQVGSRYRYQYKYRPDVLVLKKGGAWYLQIEGMNDSVRVQRLR